MRRAHLLALMFATAPLLGCVTPSSFVGLAPDVIFELGANGGAQTWNLNPPDVTQFAWKLTGNFTVTAGSPVYLWYVAPGEPTMIPVFTGFPGEPFTTQRGGVLTANVSGREIVSPTLEPSNPTPYEAADNVDISGRAGLLVLAWGGLPQSAKLELWIGTSEPNSGSLTFTGDAPRTGGDGVQVAGAGYYTFAAETACDSSSVVIIDFYRDDAPISGEIRVVTDQTYVIPVQTAASLGFTRTVYAATGPDPASIEGQIAGGGSDTRAYLLGACVSSVLPSTWGVLHEE